MLQFHFIFVLCSFIKSSKLHAFKREQNEFYYHYIENIYELLNAVWPFIFTVRNLFFQLFLSGVHVYFKIYFFLQMLRYQQFFFSEIQTGIKLQRANWLIFICIYLENILILKILQNLKHNHYYHKCFFLTEV